MFRSTTFAFPTPALLLGLGIFLCFSFSSQVHADNWPQWRGPQGNGVSRERNVPIIWSEQRNVVWKCELPPWGTSTPVTWGTELFVTAHTESNQLLLLQIDRRSGTITRRISVGQGTAPREAAPRTTQKFHRLHNLASPSPVTDGEIVVAHFGNGDLAGVDFQGNLRWKHNLQEDYGPYSIWWGHANSPTLYRDRVISVCMQDPLADSQEQPAESYLVAHRVDDGALLWKTQRNTGAPAEQADAYTTPLVWNYEGKPQLVVMGANQLDAYDPITGRQLWFLPGLVGGRTVTGPTFGAGKLFATCGMRGPLIALEKAGVGELSKRQLQWQYRQGTPDSCTPVVSRDYLFLVSDDGIARCFDTRHGELMWKKRLPGSYKASPVAANGRIYFLNTEGRCTVVSASARFDKVADNQINEQTLASPCISDGYLYIRGRSSLYCIGPTVGR